MALSQIAPATRASIVPLIEIVPSGDVDDPDVQRADASKATDKLGVIWGASGAYIDAGHYDLTTDLGATGVTALACRLLAAAGVVPIPVLRLSDPDLARQDVARLHAEFGRGVCVRLVGEDLQEDGDALEAGIDLVVADCGIRREDVDVLLDAGHVDGDVPAQLAARSIRSILREMDHLAEYRTLTVAGGAFPQDLSEFLPNTLGERPRYDADMWANLVRRGTPRPVDYGDYAVAHSLLAVGVAFAPAPQLRYTVDTSWLILKGRRNDPTGHAQFYDICDAIAGHPKFAGAALGTADRRIANSRATTTGNATTWRQLGTTHHLDFVVRRLTTLGEP